jgi:hypothetical protein
VSLALVKLSGIDFWRYSNSMMVTCRLSLTLIEPGSVKYVKYWGPLGLALLSRDVNLPLPVFGSCVVIERYGFSFGNLP